MTEQIRSSSQKTLEFEMNKQLQIFSFNPPINLFDEGKGLLGTASFEATNSVCNITDENSSFSISTPGHGNFEDEELINDLNKFLELGSENDIEQHVKEAKKSAPDRMEIQNSGYNLAGFKGFNHLKCEILAELKRLKYKDLEDMVYRMELTYDETVTFLDVKNIAGSTIVYTKPPGVYKITDINLMLKSALPKDLKVNITNNDIRLKTLSTTNRTIWFTKKHFFYVIQGFFPS